MTLFMLDHPFLLFQDQKRIMVERVWFYYLMRLLGRYVFHHLENITFREAGGQLKICRASSVGAQRAWKRSKWISESENRVKNIWLTSTDRKWVSVLWALGSPADPLRRACHLLSSGWLTVGTSVHLLVCVCVFTVNGPSLSALCAG